MRDKIKQQRYWDSTEKIVHTDLASAEFLFSRNPQLWKQEISHEDLFMITHIATSS